MRLFGRISLFYAKQMIKSPIYIGTHIFLLLMLIIRVIININSEFNYNDFGNFIGEMTIIIHVVFLSFMVFFYIFLSNEYRYGASQLFVGSLKITYIRLAAMFMNHFLFLFFFTFFQIVIIFLYFYYSNIAFSSFYIETLNYIFIYWCAPSILSFLIGVLLAITFGRRNITLIFILIIWVLVGPMNAIFFYDFFSSLDEGDAGYLLLLTPLNTDDVYRDIVGYNMSNSILISNIFWCLILCSLIIFSLMKASYARKAKILNVIIVACLLFLSFTIYPFALTGKNPVFNYNQIINEAKYSQQESPSISDDLLAYDIKNYDIEISMKKKPQVNVKLELNIYENPPDELAFSLYHSMNVERVKNHYNQDINFTQNGDFVFISNPTEELVFEYVMEDSSLLPASKSYLFLPYYINWLPSKSQHPQLMYDQDTNEEIILVSNKQPADYKLLFNGDIEYYTSLSDETGDKHFGKQDKGLTLIAGEIRENTIKDNNIIVPKSWPNIDNSWSGYYDDLVKTHLFLTEMFSLENVKLPKDILILSPHLKYDSFQNKNHLLIHHTTLLELSDSTHEIPEVYINGLLWNNRESFNLDRGLMEAFNEMLNSFLLDEITFSSSNYVNSSFDLTPSRPVARYDDIYELGIDIFYEKFVQMTQDQKKEFLIEWYDNFEEINNWEEAVIFIESFIREQV
ncbi:hypothetical protein N784_05775 [Pontibacillus litoralis JSM 072002]|uniref:Uncharacterized protein n=1 Tax=Pontibacillus litoralis JSM 072002 TaxID=1385512 RepID=A0A0A5G222_9BACI|nr:hypothetical protein N784_05775 [Pontibacillus litoralis JSM 072002]